MGFWMLVLVHKNMNTVLYNFIVKRRAYSV